MLTTQSAYLENPDMMEFTPLPNDIISEEVFPDHCKCCYYWIKDPFVKATFALFANMTTFITLFPRSNGCDFFWTDQSRSARSFVFAIGCQKYSKIVRFPDSTSIEATIPGRIVTSVPSSSYKVPFIETSAL